MLKKGPVGLCYLEDYWPFSSDIQGRRRQQLSSPGRDESSTAGTANVGETPYFLVIIADPFPIFYDLIALLRCSRFSPKGSHYPLPQIFL